MKQLSLILSILLVLSLCGCGKPVQPEPSPAPNPPANAETLPAETEPVTEPEIVQEEEEIPLPTGFEVEPAPEEAETAPSESESQSQEVAPPQVNEDEEGSAALISTKYYDIILPDGWETSSCYQTRETANGGYSVRIYESQSYWSFGGGELCTLLLTPSSDDSYKSLANYELLAALDTPEGSFYVIAVIPAKPLIMEGAEDAYNAMAEELMDVLYTIRPVDGIEMAMP